jgi:hypothetical protein
MRRTRTRRWKRGPSIRVHRTDRGTVREEYVNVRTRGFDRNCPLFANARKVGTSSTSSFDNSSADASAGRAESKG